MFFSSNRKPKKSLNEIMSSRDIRVLGEREALTINGGKKSFYSPKKTRYNWLGFPSSGITAQP